MNTSRIFRRTERWLALAACVAAACLGASGAHAQVTIAPAPLATSSNTVVKPNLLFILDDSGSMGWDFMPDYVSTGLDPANTMCKSTNSSLSVCGYGDPPYNSPDFNRIYYNPDIRYQPPVNFDGTSKQSYNTSTLWAAAPDDGYGVQATSSTNLLTGYPDVLICSTGSPTTAQKTPPFTNTTTCRLPIQAGVYTYPASGQSSGVNYSGNPFVNRITGSVTWCSSQNAQGFGSGTCQVKRTSTFKYPSYGTAFTRIDIAPKVTNTYANTFTTQSVCTSAAGNNFCGQGSSAACAVGRKNIQIVTTTNTRTVVSQGLTIISDSTVNNTGAVTTFSGACSTTTPTLQSPNPSSTVLGTTPTLISTVATTYAKTTSRTDCAGAVGAGGCSYTEEFTNFANWYVWYRTRMQMMKSAAGLAFKTIDDKYRVGFLTINPGSTVSSSKFLKISDFTAGTGNQKDLWYGKFYAQNPGSGTPLREALSRAGRYFAGLGPADTAAGGGLNRGMNDDPIQYSCQQNFAILSTDGFWNGNAGVAIDGSTPVGNQDANLASAPRPLFDGASSTSTITTTDVDTYSVCGSDKADTCSCTASKGTARRRIRDITVETVKTDTFNSSTGVTTSTTTTSSPQSTTIGSCASGTPTLPNPNPATTVAITNSSTGGSSDSLADVAQYYYITDLRGGTDFFNNPTGPSTSPSTSPTGLDISTNNVPGQSASDPQNDSAVSQHMTTFGLGLGVEGTLTFSQTYKTDTSGDFAQIKAGSLNWPVAAQNTQTAVDDLWHASVNGRGTYFSARDPVTLASGLSNALAGVNIVVGAAAAAATSNLEPVAGDNFAYVASYETVRWNGEVEARSIDLNTGAVGTTAIWSAQSQLDALANATTPGGTNRHIYRRKSGATDAGTGTNMQNFTYTNLTTGEKAYFDSPHISGGDAGYPTLSQWLSLDPVTQQSIAHGTNLVNFLRGDSTYESQTTNPAANQLFHDRQHVLGDIVNAQPVYVKAIALSYGDTGYANTGGFKDCINNGGAGCAAISGSTSARGAIVYVSSNDGMVHALNGDTGAENWAFIPNILLPNLYRLSDTDYGARHLWMVDGSPSVGDVFDPNAGTSGKWKTILVSGLNNGGRGFYALDITNPAAPVALWEFSVRTAGCPTDGSSGSVTLGTSTDDCDLGASYGNPIISKMADGTWNVFVTSGYNNTNPGDGRGYLYVLDPITGVIKKKIQACSTTPQAPAICPGSTASPVGLSKINNWVDDTTTNNLTLRVYGGDQLGNLWRFNTDTGVAYVVAKLNDTTTPTPVGQPVTTRPELGQVTGSSGTADMIYIATGRLLGTPDLSTTQVQSIYGIKDSTGGTAPVTPINSRGGTVKAQTLADTTDATGAAVRTVTNTPVTVTSSGTDGWRVDLPDSGERVNVDPKLQLGTLIIGSNVPASNACTAGGFSFLNFLDYRTGSYISSAGSNIAGQRVGNSLLVGINVVRLPNGKTVAIATTSDNQHPTLYPPFQSPNPVGRRVGWREINE